MKKSLLVVLLLAACTNPAVDDLSDVNVEEAYALLPPNEQALVDNADNGGLMTDSPADVVIRPAPQSWMGLAGTNRRQMDWLHSWTVQGGTQMGGAVRVLAGGLDNATYLRLREEVTRQTSTCDGMVAVAGRAIRRELSQRSCWPSSSCQCRHHAASLARLLGYIGVPTNVESSQVIPDPGHAWVEASCGGRNYVLDAYNGIYIRMD